MKRPSQQQIKRDLARSAEIAQTLTVIGTPVLVTDDFGKVHEAVTTSQPWMLGHGQWVINAGAKFRAYMCNRVQRAQLDPATLQRAAEAADNILRNGQPCPNDTNGDGDCGRPACPVCGRQK